MIDAVQSGTIPFASQQFARLARRRRAWAEEARAGAERALERGDDVPATASLVNVGAASSSPAASVPTPGGSFMPHYASSHFRSAAVLHQQLFHHSHKHLLWSRMRPVHDWSLCGSLDGMAVDLNQHQQAVPALSYVNSIEFDLQGSLLSTSSNNALVNIYDFDCLWMEGRGVENGKRNRVQLWREERARARESLRRPASPPRSKHGWKLNQAPPALRQIGPPPPPVHRLIAPIFSMDLQAPVRQAAATRSPPLPPLSHLKQIDTQHWSPYNSNEIAMSSQRNNQVFMSVRCALCGECCRIVSWAARARRSVPGS